MYQYTFIHSQQIFLKKKLTNMIAGSRICAHYTGQVENTGVRKQEYYCRTMPIAKFTAAQGHMQHSPSVQCSETGQQCPHTLVLAVAAAACELLSENRISGNHISFSQYSSAPQHQLVLR